MILVLYHLSLARRGC